MHGPRKPANCLKIKGAKNGTILNYGCRTKFSRSKVGTI